MFKQNAHAPALFMNIQTDVNRLTRKIKFVTLNHGKPPFGESFVRQQNYSRKSETCLFFSIIRSELGPESKKIRP